MGDLYLNRPKTVNEIRCEQCYIETFNKWLENHSNISGLREEMMKFISIPRSFEEINSVFGDKSNKLLKNLVTKGLPIVYCGDLVYLDYQLKEEMNGGEDYRSLNIACIRAFIIEILRIEEIDYNNLKIVFEETTIYDDFDESNVVVNIGANCDMLSVEVSGTLLNIYLDENNEIYFDIIDGIVIEI